MDTIDLSDINPKDYHHYFGPGYRNVCYRTNQNREGQIWLFGYDTAGNPKTFIIPHRSYIKYRVKYQTAEKDIYGNYVETKTFKSSYDRKKYLENSGSLFVVEALRPEQEFLHKAFDNCVLDPTFNKQPLRGHFIDIETEISDQFERPVDARNRINMITIYDTLTEKYYTWSLQHAEVDFKEEPLCSMPKDKFVFFEFYDDERAMLEHFISWVESNYPDYSFGWNIQAYDWPYIVRRIENVLTKEDAARLSPVGFYRIKTNNKDNERANQQADILVDIAGLFIADGLVLYRDKFHLGGALDGGHNLSNVGEHEGLGRKIEYDGTLRDLYLKDYQKFYEYNVRDVDLVVRIENKCKMVALSRQVTSSGLTNYDAIYSSISYLIGSVIAFSKTQLGCIFQSYMNTKNEMATYEGAYVFPPIPGVYKGGIATVDVNSLYPSTIRSLNLSPETYVGKIVTIVKDGISMPIDDPIDVNDTAIQTVFVNSGPNSPMKKFSRDQLLSLLKNKCILSKNNVLFVKHSLKRGVISDWCAHFYNLRKTTKKKMQKLEMAIYNKQIAESEMDATKTMIENLNAAQLAFKTMINSIYGILGTAFSPIFNVDLAQSITRNGKFFNQNASKHTKEFFMKTFGVSDDYIITVSGDTDSNFFNIKCVTDFFKKKFKLDENIAVWSDDMKMKLWKFVDGYVEKNLNPYMQQLMKTECWSDETDVLRYSLEYIGDCGIYEAKKHYAVHKIVSEGPELVNYTKYSGIELKKATVPVAIKSFLADIYDGILTKNWSNADFTAYMNSVYDKFVTMDINQLAIWKGYGTASESVGFLKMAVGATGISKACTFHNQLLAEMKIADKYDEILVGDRVRFAYINPVNRYNIEAIAFKDGQWPKEFDEVFKIDHYTMFDKVVLSPLKGLLNATKFVQSDPRNRMVQDIFQF